MRGRVLAIAGSDSGGGAGIQADIKTITALDAYAMTAITAVTVQDTHRRAWRACRCRRTLVAAQIACVLDDIGADAVKTACWASGGRSRRSRARWRRRRAGCRWWSIR